MHDRDPMLPSADPGTKTFIAGTHRLRPPQETFDDYKRWMPHMGITRVANITGLDVIGLPVYTSIRPNARSLTTSQGKGIDAASAKASALMEAIEFWHAEHIDDARLRWETPARMRRTAVAVDVCSLPAWGPIASNTPILWIEGFCLFTRQPTWVPYEAVSMSDITAGVPATPLWRTSTGLASGNHLLEAIAHALCEIIERQAEVAWGAGESQRIDPASIPPGIAASVLAMLRNAGVYACIWDCTPPNVGVPVYACDVLDMPDVGRRRLLGSYNGSGCHLSAEVAIARAVTEAVQSRLTFIAGSRDDMHRGEYGATQNEAIHELQWKELVEAENIRSFVPCALACRTFREDVERLLAAVARGGAKQAVVVDLTRTEMSIPVVKVVVPGFTEFGAPRVLAEQPR